MFFPYIKREKLCISSENHILHNIVTILHDNYHHKYLICPQVSLLALVKVKPSPKAYRKYWFNRMGKKYLDFVIVDKISSKPVLVIEVNGSSHKQLKRIRRDNFLKWIFKGVDIHFLTLDSGENPNILSEKLKLYLQ